MNNKKGEWKLIVSILKLLLVLVISLLIFSSLSWLISQFSQADPDRTCHAFNFAKWLITLMLLCFEWLCLMKLESKLNWFQFWKMAFCKSQDVLNTPPNACKLISISILLSLDGVVNYTWNAWKNTAYTHHKQFQNDVKNTNVEIANNTRRTNNQKLEYFVQSILTFQNNTSRGQE